MRAPNKQRYLNAIRHIESEEIPFLEFEFEPAITSEILGRELPRVRSYELPPADVRELVERTGMDMAYVHVLWKLGRKEVVDEEGRTHYVDGTMKQERDLKRVRYPSLDNVRRRIEAMLEELKDTDIGLVCSLNPAPFIVTTAVGYQDYYIALIDRPGFVREFQKIINEYTVKEAELALNYPIDCLKTGAVLCTAAGPMLSAEMMEEFEFPFIRQIACMAHAADVPLLLHTDGDNTSLIPKYLDLGVDALHPVEPCDGRQDIYQLKELHSGRIAFHGNIDLCAVLQYGTPDEVQRDVLEHLDRLSPGGGYVCGSSHDINDKVPVENFWAMARTVNEYKPPRKQKPQRSPRAQRK